MVNSSSRSLPRRGSIISLSVAGLTRRCSGGREARLSCVLVSPHAAQLNAGVRRHSRASLMAGKTSSRSRHKMRKIRIMEHVSLDGVIQHEDGEGFAHGGWTAPYRTPAGLEAVVEAQGSIFDLLLGR